MRLVLKFFYITQHMAAPRPQLQRPPYRPDSWERCCFRAGVRALAKGRSDDGLVRAEGWPVEEGENLMRCESAFRMASTSFELLERQCLKVVGICRKLNDKQACREIIDSFVHKFVRHYHVVRTGNQVEVELDYRVFSRLAHIEMKFQDHVTQPQVLEFLSMSYYTALKAYGHKRLRTTVAMSKYLERLIEEGHLRHAFDIMHRAQHVYGYPRAPTKKLVSYLVFNLKKLQASRLEALSASMDDQVEEALSASMDDQVEEASSASMDGQVEEALSASMDGQVEEDRFDYDVAHLARKLKLASWIEQSLSHWRNHYKPTEKEFLQFSLEVPMPDDAVR